MLIWVYLYTELNKRFSTYVEYSPKYFIVWIYPSNKAKLKLSDFSLGWTNKTNEKTEFT
jgi:hypothetical protein